MHMKIKENSSARVCGVKKTDQDRQRRPAPGETFAETV
jgi:hypothetical protein